MASGSDSSVDARIVDLLSQLIGNGDIDALLGALAKGEIGSDRVVTELAMRYQRGIGSAALALAEQDKDAARKLGERLRSRIDEFLAQLASRDTASPSTPTPPLSRDTFKDREDTVLLREYVILKAVEGRNLALKSALLFEAVKKVISGVQDDVVTAQLARMVKSGVLGKERKGRYNAVAQSPAYLTSLAAEIEGRGLQLPQTVPVRED